MEHLTLLYLSIQSTFLSLVYVLCFQGLVKSDGSVPTPVCTSAEPSNGTNENGTTASAKAEQAAPPLAAPFGISPAMRQGRLLAVLCQAHVTLHMLQFVSFSVHCVQVKY